MSSLKVEWDDLESFEHELEVYKGVLFTGSAVEYYDNGDLLSETEIINGRWSGWSREWYPNGQLKVEEHYIHEVLDGMHREWFQNGQLRLEKKVVEAIVVESKEWDEQGNLIKTFTISEIDSLFKLLQIRLENRARWLEIVKDWESKTIYVKDGDLVFEE